MALHRYWRVYIAANNGSAISGLQELEFRSTPAGADETGVGLGAAISSGDYSGAMAKEQAFDDTVAEWASSGMSCWIGWDFGVGVTKQIEEISLQIRTTDPTNAVLQAPRLFYVEGSDDAVIWNRYWGCGESTGWTAGETRTYTDPLYPDRMGTAKYLAYVATGVPPATLSTPKLPAYAVLGATDLSTPKYLAYAALGGTDLHTAKYIAYAVTGALPQRDIEGPAPVILPPEDCQDSGAPDNCCVPEVNGLIETRVGPLNTPEDIRVAIWYLQDRQNVLVREWNKLAAVTRTNFPRV